MFNDNFISNVTGDIYTRKYALNPQSTNGRQVFVYAGCSLNTEREDEDEGYYLLTLYLSVDEGSTLDHIIGLPFGTEGMDKQRMDIEMDHWVKMLADDDSFFLQIDACIKKEKMWENFLNDVLLGGMDDTK